MIICKVNSQSIFLAKNSPYRFSQKSQHYSKFSTGYDYSRQYNGQINLIKFASYRIGFCSVSQNYTVWCEHTFPSNIYVEYEFKNFEHYFNLFWWKKQPFEKKKNKRKYNNSNNKTMSKVLKVDFVLSGDEIQSLHSLANPNSGC